MKLVFFDITDMDLQGDGDCSDNDNNPMYVINKVNN